MANTILRAGTYGAGREVLRKALSEHLPFKTSGALRGEEWTQDMVTVFDLGWLNAEESNTFMIDHIAGITYVVYSYETPIAWVRADGHVHYVEQRFSPTTSKHQGMLYMM